MNFMNKTNPIGIFDSGIGGLTVVKKIKAYLPGEEIIYFGDTARVPYGTKSNSTVIEYSLQDAQFLANKSVKMIIVACNTASAVALDELREKFELPIIGMIEPGAKMASQNSRNGKIGVIGTYATINNGAYAHALKEINSEFKVFEKACPLFVPLAEEGWTNHQATKLIAEEYLAELKAEDIDTLILGCTHYPLLTDVIQEVMGEDVKLIDSGTAASMVVEEHLNGRGLLNTSNSYGKGEFFVSDIPTKFKDVAERFLGTEITNISKIDLDEHFKTDK